MSEQGRGRFQLPVAEDDLWAQVVVRLLAQRDMDAGQARDHLRLLEELAFHQRFCGKPLTRPFAEDTATWLAQDKAFGSPREQAHAWLADVAQWELLMRRGSGQDALYDFAMPTLDEYFAACHLAARWAEGDKRYREWLPSAQGQKGRKLLCPNPVCQATLPPFHMLLREAKHEELLLLLVSLLKDAEREEVLLKRVTDLPLRLKCLSRCRYTHVRLVQKIPKAIYEEGDIWTLADGLASLQRARVHENCAPLVRFFAKELRQHRGGYFGDEPGAALLVLCFMGHAAIKPLITLLWQMDEDDHEQRIADLRDIGDPAVEFFILALQDEDTTIRRRAAHVLGRIEDFGEAALREKCDAAEALIAALQDEAPEVRFVAAYSLKSLGDSAVKPLIATLEDSNAKVRGEAAITLGRIGNKQALPALHRLLEDPDAAVRTAAQRALAEIKRLASLRS